MTIINKIFQVLLIIGFSLSVGMSSAVADGHEAAETTATHEAEKATDDAKKEAKDEHNHDEGSACKE